MSQDFVVAIPARHDATRLPGKPLRLLGGQPLVLHVAQRALAAGAREVWVATDDARIADALERTHRDTPRVLEFRREADRFVILLRDMEDLTMERLALKDKGNLFADVFGLVP